MNAEHFTLISQLLALDMYLAYLIESRAAMRKPPQIAPWQLGSASGGDLRVLDSTQKYLSAETTSGVSPLGCSRIV
jgi:hypothetical protein